MFFSFQRLDLPHSTPVVSILSHYTVAGPVRRGPACLSEFVDTRRECAFVDCLVHLDDCGLLVKGREGGFTVQCGMNGTCRITRE